MFHSLPMSQRMLQRHLHNQQSFQSHTDPKISLNDILLYTVTRQRHSSFLAVFGKVASSQASSISLLTLSAPPKEMPLSDCEDGAGHFNTPPFHINMQKAGNTGKDGHSRIEWTKQQVLFCL